MTTTKQEVTCQHCHGYGDLVESTGRAGSRPVLVRCPVCQGKGTVRQ